jgi:hypothetical protein
MVSWLIERKAGTSYREAERQLKTLQRAIDDKRFVSDRTTVLEQGCAGFASTWRRNLRPSTAANYKGVFYAHIAPMLGAFRLDESAQG